MLERVYGDWMPIPTSWTREEMPKNLATYSAEVYFRLRAMPQN